MKIEKYMDSFKKEFHKQVRGIWELEFSLRSEPYHAWMGKYSPAIHVRDINGDLQYIVPVTPNEIMQESLTPLTRLLESW